MQHKAAGLSHNPLKAIVSPRPIAWVSSRGADGSINLAPYSFFNAVSEDPAMLFFSAAVLAGGQRKDSLRNIEETGEFTVNVVGEAQFDAMNISSGNFPYGDNEFINAGLEMVALASILPLVSLLTSGELGSPALEGLLARFGAVTVPEQTVAFAVVIVLAFLLKAILVLAFRSLRIELFGRRAGGLGGFVCGLGRLGHVCCLHR